MSAMDLMSMKDDDIYKVVRWEWVRERERETLHSWSCFTTRQRIFDDLAVSTSHPPKNQGRVTEWSRAAEKSRPIYTHSSTAPLTLERLLHAALYGLSSDSTTSIYSSLYDVEKEWDDQLTCHIWRHSSDSMSNAKPVVCFFTRVCASYQNIFKWIFFFFSFLHIDIASRRSILPWPLGVIYLVETGFHGHVY